MEISAEKTKLTTNSANGIHKEIKVKRKMLDTVINVKYLIVYLLETDTLPRHFHFL